MTVIAWDGKTLAADRQSTFGYVQASTTKIKWANGHTIFAACGPHSGQCRELFEWFRGGEKPEDYPTSNKSDALVIRRTDLSDKNPKCLYYEAGCKVPVLIESPFFAIGSGAEYAMATMLLEHDAIKAVNVASVLSKSCGQGWNSASFNQPLIVN